MGRFPAYVLAALLATLIGAPAAWAQGQGYPYGAGYNGYGSSTTFSSYPYYGSSVSGQYGGSYSSYPYGQWGSTTTGYSPSTTYGYAPNSQYAYGYGYSQSGSGSYGYYGYGQPGNSTYGYQYGQPAYGQPAPYGSSPFAYPPPAYGAPYGGAPNGYAYGPPPNPSYAAPYGAVPPAGGYPTDPYGYGQLASNPYGPPAAYPQVSQTSQTTQTGCNGTCTLGTYFYGVGVPSSTPYTGATNQITPYNVGGLASALTGVNMPVGNSQPMQFPENVTVSPY
jgi:hypothetical protein